MSRATFLLAGSTGYCPQVDWDRILPDVMCCTNFSLRSSLTRSGIVRWIFKLDSFMPSQLPAIRLATTN